MSNLITITEDNARGDSVTVDANRTDLAEAMLGMHAGQLDYEVAEGYTVTDAVDNLVSTILAGRFHSDDGDAAVLGFTISRAV